MCYSAEVSLGTFATVSIISLYLWNRNNKIDRGVALLLIIIGFMQLLEYILWINPECNDANKLVSATIPFYLYLQPALIAFVIWQTGAGWGTLYPWIVIVSLLGLIPYTTYKKNNAKVCIHKGECGHLDWNTLDNLLNKKLELPQYISYILYYGAMAYVIGTLKNALLSYIMLALYGVSWLVTNMMYNDVWGSVWCHSVNAAAIVALLV